MNSNLDKQKKLPNPIVIMIIYSFNLALYSSTLTNRPAKISFDLAIRSFLFLKYLIYIKNLTG